MLHDFEIIVIGTFITGALFLAICCLACLYVILVREKSQLMPLYEKRRERSFFWRQGIECIELGKLNDGLKFLEKARSIDGDNPNLRRLIGILYYEMKLYNDAMWELDRALRLNPNDQEALTLHNKIGEYLEYRQSIRNFYSKPRRR